jgi:DNA-binding MarR family transcriptional regulator
MSQPAKSRSSAKAAAERAEGARVRPSTRVRAAAPLAGATHTPRIDLAGLELHVGYALRRAQVWVFQDVRRTLKEHDITPAQFSVMKIVGANPGLAQVRVAEVLSIERARLVQMLDQLEARGLIARTRSASDRRSHALHLSPEGAAMLERLVVLLQEHERRVLARIGSKGKSDLLRILAPFLR